MVGFEQILVGEEGGENRRENEGGEKGEEILVGPKCFLPKPTKIFIPQNWRDLSRGVLRKHSNYSFHCALTLLLLLCVCVCVCVFFFFFVESSHYFFSLLTCCFKSNSGFWFLFFFFFKSTMAFKKILN